MRMRIALESQLCAWTKNVLFSGPALLDQWSLQFIIKVLINCKKSWYNKAEIRTFFVHAHNCDSRVSNTCTLRIIYLLKISFERNMIFKRSF